MANEEITNNIHAEPRFLDAMDKGAKAADGLAKASMAESATLAMTEDAVPLPPLGSGLKVLMVWPRFAPSFSPA